MSLLPRAAHGTYKIETSPASGSLYRQPWLLHARILVPAVDQYLVKTLSRPLSDWVADTTFDDTVRGKVMLYLREHLALAGIQDAEAALKEWLADQGKYVFTGGVGHSLSYTTPVGSSWPHTCIKPDCFEAFLKDWTDTTTLLFYATGSKLWLSDKAYPERWGN